MSERWDQEFERERAPATALADEKVKPAPPYLVVSWNDVKKWANEHGLEFTGNIDPVNNLRRKLGRRPFAMVGGPILAGIRGV